MRLCVATMLLVVGMGCSPDRAAPFRVTASNNPPPGAPPAQQQGSPVILVHNVRIVPPPWLEPADYAAMAAATEEYVLDASAALGGWLPEPETPARFPLEVILHDVQGGNYWAEVTRTAWLEWPKGATGKPRVREFMPFLAVILVLDRRREQGRQGYPVDADENDAMSRGSVLPVVLKTAFPGMYDP